MAEYLTQPTNTTTKRIFIAGTRMNEGKTTTCLGLFEALRNQFDNVGFIKPVGQRFIEIDGQLIDEDSILLEQIFKVDTPISSMSPIAIDSTFTRRYLESPSTLKESLTHKLCGAFDRASLNMDFTIIEGSGHAGVGSVFDMSNARVAKTLKAKAIIVSRGGIGQPIDEIALNKALFDKEGVEVIGAIINKVQEDKIDVIRKYTQLALDNLGIPLLGVLPTRKVLTSPNLSQIAQRVSATWLNTSKSSKGRRIDNVIIGAMSASRVFDTLTSNTLLITPGDREDIIMSVLSYAASKGCEAAAGIVLTRGIMPHPRIQELISKSNLPVMLAAADSYNVASRINGMTVKTQPADLDKIPVIKKLIQENIDLRQLISSF